MKTLKTFCIGFALSIGLALSAAAQNVVWSANITNSLASQAVGSAATNSLGNISWTSGPGIYGSTSTNYVDILGQKTLTIFATVKPIQTAANAANNGTATFGTLYSPDLVDWVPGSNVVVTISSTNPVPVGTSLQIDGTKFRYFALTNCAYTFTNSYVTNSDIHFKLLFK